MPQLFTETVEREFIGGPLAGIRTTERIPRVAHPRAIGAIAVIDKPCGNTSPYRDRVIAVEAVDYVYGPRGELVRVSVPID